LSARALTVGKRGTVMTIGGSIRMNSRKKSVSDSARPE
jgi:hypothetical protein